MVVNSILILLMVCKQYWAVHRTVVQSQGKCSGLAKYSYRVCNKKIGGLYKQEIRLGVFLLKTPEGNPLSQKLQRIKGTGIAPLETGTKLNSRF